MENQNPYEVLGIDRNASADEIKSVYKKNALKHHPDRGGDENKFKEMTEAYSILSDPTKKSNYDKFGSVDNSNINMEDIINNMFGFGDINIDDILNDISQQNSFNTGFDTKPKVFIKIHRRTNINPNSNLNSNPLENLLNLNNLFDDILGDDIFSGGIDFNNKGMYQQPQQPQQSQQPQQPHQPQQTKPKYDTIEVLVGLEEIIDSTKKKVKYNINDLCEICRNFMIKCLNCNGIKNRMDRCYSCNGKGIIITNKDCIKCNNGLSKKEVEINIQIPKGVKDGHIFQLKNKGSFNMETQTYNHLKIIIKHKLPKNIQIHGSSIFMYVDLKLEELLCGFTKKIKCGNTEFDLKMDNYFDPTEALVYKKMGIPTYKDEKNVGDLVIKFNILYPKENDERMKKYDKVFKKIFS